jgi:hypothetical protein
MSGAHVRYVEVRRKGQHLGLYLPRTWDPPPVSPRRDIRSRIDRGGFWFMFTYLMLVTIGISFLGSLYGWYMIISMLVN